MKLYIRQCGGSSPLFIPPITYTSLEECRQRTSSETHIVKFRHNYSLPSNISQHLGQPLILNLHGHYMFVECFRNDISYDHLVWTYLKRLPNQLQPPVWAIDHDPDGSTRLIRLPIGFAPFNLAVDITPDVISILQLENDKPSRILGYGDDDPYHIRGQTSTTSMAGARLYDSCRALFNDNIFSHESLIDFLRHRIHNSLYAQNILHQPLVSINFDADDLELHFWHLDAHVALPVGLYTCASTTTKHAATSIGFTISDAIATRPTIIDGETATIHDLVISWYDRRTLADLLPELFVSKHPSEHRHFINSCKRVLVELMHGELYPWGVLLSANMQRDRFLSRTRVSSGSS